jgi:GH15 family glucan-1,4-alpha-glucosidase
MNSYLMPPRISDYGIIGDCHSAGLISRHCSVDWLCFPRFDSPSVFARILDFKEGGHFAVTPSVKFDVTQKYVQDTAILESIFDCETGSLSIRNFMPIYEKKDGGLTKRSYGIDESIVTHHRLAVTILGLKGKVAVRSTFTPRFNYSALKPSMKLEGKDGLIAYGKEETLALTHLGSSEEAGEGSWRICEYAADHNFILNENDRHDIVLTYSQSCRRRSERLTRAAIDHELRRTHTFWKKWVEICKYKGEYRSQVVRSLITLKLLTYAPTGAIIAAPTTSLPESIGGVRNWDYRYCWLRDASFTIMAFMRLGYIEEAEGLMYWLVERVKARKRGLKILETVDGKQTIREEELDWLAGYENSRPVRIGNAAVEQTQLDVFGEVTNAFYHYVKNRGKTPSELWQLMFELVDHVAEHWSDTDRGIWEPRTRSRHYVYSKAMCWLTLYRGVQLATIIGKQDCVERWSKIKDIVKSDVLEKGFNKQIGAFTQSYSSDELDASVLRLPMIGFIDARNVKMLSTISAIEKALSMNSLLYRYRTHDGVGGDEGCFLIATFWFIDNLIRIGKVEEAKKRFDELTKYANHLGLLSEEIDPRSHELLGNFPQAFTHIGLINSALDIEDEST